MAKPDKTDLLNAHVARSMNAWAKATTDLDREHKGKHLRVLKAKLRAVKQLANARAG